MTGVTSYNDAHVLFLTMQHAKIEMQWNESANDYVVDSASGRNTAVPQIRRKAVSSLHR